MALVVTVRCEVPGTGRLFYEMDTVQLDKPADLPRAADIVFVIQHAPCNRNLMNKISTLVDGLDKAMRTQGLTSLRYAVVGFGGKQLHLADAHVHTMDGQVFNSANRVRTIYVVITARVLANIFIPSASPVLSRFTSSSTCQPISVIIPALIIHHSFTLSLHAQHLPFQQILLTLDFFYLLDCLHENGTGLGLSCSSFHF